MTRTKNRGNQSIECMRFLCCVSIMFIHTGFPLPPAVGGYAMALARFAVPFLILLSGWYTDHDGGSRKAKKKLKDTLRVALIGGIICILWNCVNSYLKELSFTSWIIPYRNRLTLINFLLFNRAVFFNSVFYYFFIMIYVYGIFILTQRFRITRYICFLIPLFLLTGIYICEFSDFPWYYGGNYLFLGLPVFLLGYSLRRCQNQLIRLRSKEWVLILMGVLLTLLEHRLKGAHYFYCSTILIAVSVFLFCVNHENLQCPATLVTAGTYLTVPMIVIHCEILATLNIAFTLNHYQLSLSVLLLSILLSIAYVKIRRRI